MRLLSASAAARAVAVALVAAAALAGRAAHARSTAVLSYPLADVWSSAVRFVRVDRGYTIKEKDEDSGYILFEIGEGGKSYKASLELIRATDDEGRDATRAAFSIPDLPRHYEVMLLDKLGAKVREERGSPAPRPPPRKPPAEHPVPPDGGALPRPPHQKDLPR
jgi:hypothetical protein